MGTPLSKNYLFMRSHVHHKSSSFGTASTQIASSSLFICLSTHQSSYKKDQTRGAVHGEVMLALKLMLALRFLIPFRMCCAGAELESSHGRASTDAGANNNDDGCWRAPSLTAMGIQGERGSAQALAVPSDRFSCS